MTVIAVDRAFKLLRALPRTDGTLSELSRETGLPVATVFRLMGTLEQAGAVSRLNKSYRIGPVMLELGGSDAATFDLLSLATAHLTDLRAETGETAGIAESRGTDHVHLGQVATTHDVSVRDWTGVKVAGHAGCIGFALMAYWSDAKRDAYLASELERFSAATLVDRTDIEPLLDELRSTGWLWTEDHYAVGVTTVAAPILDRRGAAVASLYLHGPSYRFPQDGRRDAIGRNVGSRAAAISSVLGYQGGSAR